MPQGFNVPPGGQAQGAFEPGSPTPETYGLYTRGDEPIAGLPPSVAEKVFRVREIADDRHRRLPDTSERLEANQARGDAQRALDRLLAPPHNLREHDTRVAMQRRVLADATIAAERLDARYQAASREWEPAARTHAAVDSWLRNRRHGTTIEPYIADPRLLKGEDILAAGARLARRCRELRADAHRVSSAAYPLAHARARCREIVERLAQPPNVSALVEHEAGEIWWPTQSLQSQVMNINPEAGRPIAFAEIEAAIPLLAWLLKKELIAGLDTLLAEEADDANALSIVDRQKQAATIQGDLLAVEYDLAAMVWRGLNERLPCWFDPDQSAMTIVGAQLVTHLAVNGAATTSPERGGVSNPQLFRNLNDG